MSGIVVVGGGLAGAAAAALLARSGLAVQVLEREKEPRDKICGEFLSVEAQSHLAALGLDLQGLGGAPIRRLRLVAGRRSVEADLPFTALGLTRRRLDDALLNHAERLGAEVQRGTTVRTLGPHHVETSAGALQAGTVLLASGKHDVRGARRWPAHALDGSVGFKMYFRVKPAVRAALSGFIEVVLFEGGYAGLQLVEGGVANLCLLVREGRFHALGRRWDALFDALLAEPHLRSRLADAEPLLARPLTIAGVPYGFLHRDRPADGPGPFRLGDQAAVIPSFSGDGMAIALHSARLAAEAVRTGVDARSYHVRLRRDVGRQVKLATSLQRMSEGRLGRGMLIRGLGVAPQLLPALASWTRVPDRALRAAGVAVVEAAPA